MPSRTLIGLGLAAIFSIAHADGRPSTEKSHVTLPQVQQVIVPGSLMKRPAIPDRYHAVLGWAQAVTLSANQGAATTARVELDWMRLWEQDPATGVLTVPGTAALTFEQPLAYQSQGELYNRLCADGSYSNSCWMVGGTTTIRSTAADGVVSIDLAPIANKVPHWWTPRAAAKAGGRYFVQAKFRVIGAAAIQFGVDYWVDTCSPGGPCAPYNGFDPNCQTSNNCEAWVSKWFGDTGGEFVLILLPADMPRSDPPAHFDSAEEYYHSGFDHYFITTLADEISKLDTNVFIGWDRTGESISVIPANTAGTLNVCRFFSASFAPKSSHFYSALPSECAFNRTDPARVAAWTDEGNVFGLIPADAQGNCPVFTFPVYRLYNNGQGGAPNHRYTTRLASRAQMIAQGWIPEGSGIGVIGCTALGT